ncbi:hypothetical protein K501DRAFT_78347, partial [Backusella circina FSU 941]
MTSQNINIAFKRKSISIAGVSPMSYSPSSHTMPAIFQHRDSFVHQRELESAFCSDLVCCGIPIKDLHELLHHYEELHHAPIDEEPTTEGEGATPVRPEPIKEDEEEPFPLPTQPHELAALSPRLKTLQPVVQPPSQQSHTEDILKQHLPALMT